MASASRTARGTELHPRVTKDGTCQRAKVALTSLFYRIIEQCGLEGTLRITWFQLPAIGKGLLPWYVVAVSLFLLRLILSQVNGRIYYYMKHKHLITRKRDYGTKTHLEDSPDMSYNLVKIAIKLMSIAGRCPSEALCFSRTTQAL